jgi:mannose/fructose-specific phosphotransferase system component IIA
MTLIYEEVMVKKSKKIEETENQVDETLGDLNPNYFEEIINLKEAKERIKASDIYAGSKFNLFSTF